MKHLATILRAVALVAFFLLMHYFGRQAQMISQKDYNPIPYAIFLPAVSILFGALLRSDVFFRKDKIFRVDWLSLLLIGLPSLLVALSMPISFSILANMPLPNFFTFFWDEQVHLFAGVVFGYTVVNSLFIRESAGLRPGPP